MEGAGNAGETIVMRMSIVVQESGGGPPVDPQSPWFRSMEGAGNAGGTTAMRIAIVVQESGGGPLADPWPPMAS